MDSGGSRHSARNFLWLISVVFAIFTAQPLNWLLSWHLHWKRHLVSVTFRARRLRSTHHHSSRITSASQLSSPRRWTVSLELITKSKALPPRSPSPSGYRTVTSRTSPCILDANSRAVNISFRSARNAFVKLKRVPVQRSFPEFSSFSCVVSSSVVLYRICLFSGEFYFQSIDDGWRHSAVASFSFGGSSRELTELIVWLIDYLAG